jgi:hypothetical protein
LKKELTIWALVRSEQTVFGFGIVTEQQSVRHEASWKNAQWKNGPSEGPEIDWALELLYGGGVKVPELGKPVSSASLRLFKTVESAAIPGGGNVEEGAYEIMGIVTY